MSGGAAILFAAQVVAVWSLAAYGPLPRGLSARPFRATVTRTVLAFAGVIVVGWRAEAVPLAALIAASAFVLHAFRPAAIAALRLHVWEVACNASVVAAAVIAAVYGARVGFPYLRMPVPEQDLATLYLLLAAAMLGTRASGYVVRGVLDRAGITAEANVAGTARHSASLSPQRG